MSIIALALLAALNGAPNQDEAPRVETRSEVRVITTDGEGPGRLDADGDGVITREEFSAPMGQAFDRLDADHDGRLSTEELAAGPGGPGREGHRVMMMGGPGGPGVRVFTSRLDSHDGPDGHGEGDVHIITRDGAGGHGMPTMIHGGPGGPGVQIFTSRTGPDRGPMTGGPGQVFVRRFGGPDGPGEMDKDGDGKVSQDEFTAPLREAFGRMDADHDGFLDEGEGHPAPPSDD